MKGFSLFAWLLTAVAPPVYSMQAEDGGQTTDIAIGSAILQHSVKRLGINLGNMTYYDAGQLTKNLVMRNPGFEGEIYQSIIRCAAGTPTTCVDDDAVSAWPKGFWNGARFEIFYGAAQGRTGTITGYTAASGKSGGTFAFSQSGVAPVIGDYMIVRMTVPGNATAGWWPKTSGNAKIATNTSDLPPDTAGRQTAAVTTLSADDKATLTAFFDSHAGRSFLVLNGTFRLSFKAKGLAGSKAVAVSLARNNLTTYLSTAIQLTDDWKTYNLTFTAHESGSTLNSVALQFAAVEQDSFLIDDVSLTQTNSDPSNTTAFGDGVVQALKTLRPGLLRFWAGQLGDTLDNMIAGPYARQRSGYLAWFTRQEDISYGLPEFLDLCAAIGAEPWIVVPSTFSTDEAAHLIEYLAGAPSTAYGSRRAALGSPEPWTSSFRKIHLEFGNEAWNGAFKGGTIEYPEPYGRRAQTIFASMRGDPSFNPPAFDLVLGGQAVSPGRNRIIQDHCSTNDSFTIAPYMMNTVDSFRTAEELFGSTFAEPEALVSPKGTAEGVPGGLILQNQKALQASAHPVPLTVYETNLSTTSGMTQTALNEYVSSLGAGLAVADSMLQQMEHGVLLQNLWNLSQYNFARPDKSVAWLWGAVVDMGATNRRRPQYLALQLVNEAIGANVDMVKTIQSGVNPTWDQPMLNTVRIQGAHHIQSYAFASASNYSLLIFNLHRNSALPVTLGGPATPSGTVARSELSAGSVTDTNESSEMVRITRQVIQNFDPTTPLILPPYSMTLFTWTR